MKTYTGSCHCGRVRFEVDAELDQVRACDCSICTKRGGLMHRVAESRIRLLTPLAELTLYQWGTRTAADYFCPVCGILPFRRPSARTPAEIARGVPEFTGWSVNVRCLDGVELGALPVRHVRGREL